MPRYVLIGNYGAGNAGDEALRDAFERVLPPGSCTVMTAVPSRPGDVHRLPAGLRSLLSMRWVRSIGVLKRADAVIFGGGTLLTDVESVHACFLWWFHARAASFFGVPVLFAGQGIGPFRTKLGRWFAANALRKACFISVRDEPSAVTVESFHLNTKIVRTFDPALLYLESQKISIRSKNVIIFIPRNCHSDELLSEAKRYVSSAAPVRILRLDPGDRAETRATDELRAILPRAEVVDAPRLDLVARHMADAALVITQRYHGAIAALALGIPCRTLPQAPGDKLDSLRPLLSLPPAEALERLHRQANDGMDALRKTLQTLTGGSSGPQQTEVRE